MFYHTVLNLAALQKVYCCVPFIANGFFHYLPQMYVRFFFCHLYPVVTVTQ